MPTYEYQCKTCGSTFDVFQSIKARPLKRHRCEACDQVRAVSRLIGAGSALIFKGSGFYQTDYRSDSFKKAAKAEADAAKPKKDAKYKKSGGGDAKKTKSDTKKPKD